MYADAHGGQRHHIPFSYSYGRQELLTWMLETTFRSSARSVPVLNPESLLCLLEMSSKTYICERVRKWDPCKVWQGNRSYASVPRKYSVYLRQYLQYQIRLKDYRYNNSQWLDGSDPVAITSSVGIMHRLWVWAPAPHTSGSDGACL